jgi:hypothetical protein
MNCRNCPDRDICMHFNLSLNDGQKNFGQLKNAYLRTMRCRRKKFGRQD